IPLGITASTGVAATHINGITINSWAGLGLRDHITFYEIQDLLKRRYLRRRFLATKVLIIDEVSMLSANTLEVVDTMCKEFRQSREPFGGMQVILCGDFSQLPPVFRNSTPNYVYSSRLWEEL